MSQIVVQRGSPTQDETVVQKRRTTHFMPQRKQEHIYGRVGETIDGSTWFGNEGSCGGVHRKETRGYLLPKKCADRHHMGY